MSVIQVTPVDGNARADRRGGVSPPCRSHQGRIGETWRTIDGARDWLTIRAYISTLATNGLNIYQALRDALAGNPRLPPLPT